MFEKFIAALGMKPQQAEITQVINLYDAVLAHTAWKRRLFEFLEGQSREELHPGKICVDHLCVLGKWIHSDGKRHFGDEPEFIKLVEEHAKFHAHAASVVEAHLVGDTG
ncbi:MAG: CZB domain-containing protein, partial [Sideroxydans sp.]